MAESVIVGTVEEIVLEGEGFSHMEYVFSVKDEASGNYFFMDKKEIKGLDVKHGDRVSIKAECEGSQISEISEINLL
ncbi:hypothetical protein ACJJI4_09565 [Microbulbifer sp. TRSA002]|uniref:hypothetical protein n=1 Tax=Microbulbifer sp. TRSA002 TaxID=3243382 RepID=UPI004039A45F